MLGEKHLTWVHNNESIDLLCPNPSFYLRNQYKLFSKIVAFSATLKPFDFYINMSGLNKTIQKIEAESPFPAENRKLLLIPQVSTLYRNRQRDLPRICDAIKKFSDLNEGNYFVFFPSYQFMEMAEKEFAKSGIKLWMQKRNISNYEVENLRRDISAENGLKLFLAVQGGSLSEGLDINTPNLKGVYIVGPAIPRFTEKMEIRKKEPWSRSLQKDTTIPIYTRQCVAPSNLLDVSSEVLGKKKGLIVLFDARFALDDYAVAMPSYWYGDSVRELCQNNLIDGIKLFWNDEER